MRRSLTRLADEPTADAADNTETDEVIEETTEGEGEQESNKKKDENTAEGEEEFVDPDLEEGAEEEGDAAPGGAGEDETDSGGDSEGSTESTPTQPPAVPVEQQPRHDTGVNSVDLVVKASNVLRAAGEITQGYQTEDASDKEYLKRLWLESDEEGRRMGNIALELGSLGQEVCEKFDEHAAVSQAGAIFAEDEDAPVNGVAMESISLLLEHIATRNRLPTKALRALATESHLKIASDHRRRNLVTLGFSSVISSIIDAIARGFKAVWKWFTSFFSSAEEKVKQTAAIAVGLEKKAKSIQEKTKKLNSEQKENAKKLFDVCQRYDPDRPGETLTGLPEFIKAKEEVFKKAVAERGSRLSQEDLVSFYTNGVFIQPGALEEQKNKFGDTLEQLGIFLKVVGVSLELSEGIMVKALESLTDDAGEEQLEAEVEKLGKLWRELGGMRQQMEPVEADSGLTEINDENVLAIVGKRDLAFLPNDQILVAVVPKSEDFETMGKALPLLSLKIQGSSVSSARVKACVNHTEPDQVVRGLVNFTDNILESGLKMVKEKGSLIEKYNASLVERMEDVKKTISEKETANSSKVALLNAVAKLTALLASQFTPSVIKTVVTLCADYMKHAKRSLDAAEMVLEFV